MPRKPNPIPPYRKQKRPSGTIDAFVVLEGHRIYLGSYGSNESKERYERVLAEWRSGCPSAPMAELSVAEVVAAFWTFAEDYYRRPDGTTTNELATFRYALRPLLALYASTPASRFGPKSLKTVRTRMIELGWCRTHINKSVSRVRQVFRWGVESELVPPSVYHALLAVRGLAKGRSNARENPPKRPVSEDHIEAIHEHVSRQVWALIQLQLLTGARGSEVLGLRSVDIDTSKPVWCCRIDRHKTAHHGHDRTLYFGPRAQNVLAEFMADRRVDAFLFSPREAEADRHAEAPTHRRAEQVANPKKTARKVGERYTPESYARSIQRACVTASIPTWSPHRLRHSAATRMRAEIGIDLTQTVLGHRLGSRITELYAEANVARAVQVIEKFG